MLKVYAYISAENDIKAVQALKGFQEIDGLKRDHGPDVVSYFPDVAGMVKILFQFIV